MSSIETGEIYATSTAQFELPATLLGIEVSQRGNLYAVYIHAPLRNGDAGDLEVDLGFRRCLRRKSKHHFRDLCFRAVLIAHGKVKFQEPQAPPRQAIACMRQFEQPFLCLMVRKQLES